MPNYLTPGVYVEEIPAQSKPIEGVATSVAAFIGLAPGGPVNTPMRISNWTQFSKIFGDPRTRTTARSWRARTSRHAVYGFFQNGGSTCWIVRVGADVDSGPAQAQAALPAATDKGIEAFRAVALPGVDGAVTVEIAEEKAEGATTATPRAADRASRSRSPRARARRRSAA